MVASYRLFPSISPDSSSEESQPATTETRSDDTPTCGYQDCRRTVDSPDERCWQHADAE